MAKKRRKRKKKNNSGKKVAIIIFLVILLFAAAIVLVMMNWRSIIRKAEDLLPSAFTYPTEYEEYVTKYGIEYNVEPALIYAIIKTESSFDPKAESEVGARGLMQLMKEAFEWLKYRMNDKSDINFDSMFDPQTNIKYGTYYLSFLLEHYNNNIDLAAAAYHGGMGLVDGWITDGIIDVKNVDVDKIPKNNDKTAEYIKRIRKAYNKYTVILKEKKIITQ